MEWVVCLNRPGVSWLRCIQRPPIVGSRQVFATFPARGSPYIPLSRRVYNSRYHQKRHPIPDVLRFVMCHVSNVLGLGKRVVQVEVNDD
jgi:hypothetical protein